MINPDSTDFLLHSASLLNWGDLSGKVVMDIGSGNEGNSTYRLTQLFPNMRKLVAIDQCLETITAARSAQVHPKVEYHVGRIDYRPSMVEWEGGMQVIVSHFCFNCIRNQNEAFENVYRLLAPGGSAAFRFTLWSNFYDWVKEMTELYIELAEGFDKEPPESHTMNYPASHYIQVLTDIGFNVVECEEESSSQQFETDIQCQNYLGTICPFASKIPSAVKDEFLYQIFLAFVKHNPRNDHGFACLKYRIAKILVTKPTSVI